MSAVQSSARTRSAAPFFIQFKPLQGDRRDIWTVRLEPDILTLMKPGDKCVLQLHREEAARYLRFSHDLVRGRTLTFHVIEGLKSYSFPCTKVQMLKLVAWMPHKETSEIAKEVRVSGLGVVLFGILHLLLAHNVWLGWGVALTALGLSGICAPKRGMYGTNGALLLAAGLGDLVASSFTATTRQTGFFDPGLLPIAVGILLIIWGIHQLSMLGPNQLLRAARAIRDRQASLFPVDSQVVRRIGLWNLAAAGVFGAYAGFLWFTGAATRSMTGPIADWSPDFLVFAALAVVSLLSAAILLHRKRPAYFEAKVSAQMLLGIVILSAWGLVISLVSHHPPSAFGDVFALDHAVSAPVAWVLLILWVSVFNRWYGQAVDRELEAQRV